MSDFRQDISSEQLIKDAIKSISIDALDRVHAAIYLDMTQRLMPIDELKGLERALWIIKAEIERLGGES